MGRWPRRRRRRRSRRSTRRSPLWRRLRRAAAYVVMSLAVSSFLARSRNLRTTLNKAVRTGAMVSRQLQSHGRFLFCLLVFAGEFSTLRSSAPAVFLFSEFSYFQRVSHFALLS